MCEYPKVTSEGLSTMRRIKYMEARGRYFGSNAVVQKLVNQGYMELSRNIFASDERYVLTVKGHEYLLLPKEDQDA